MNQKELEQSYTSIKDQIKTFQNPLNAVAAELRCTNEFLLEILRRLPELSERSKVIEEAEQKKND